MCLIPARLIFLLYNLLVLWRRCEATISSSNSLECSLPGLCKDFLLNEYSSPSLESCILLGRSTPSATWVSFNMELGACSALQTCENLDANLQNHVSSSINCTVCNVVGSCQGLLLIDYYAESAEDCLGLCGMENDCSWYSFSAEDQFCYLFTSCLDLLVDGHEKWISGELACSAGSTTSPSPTTTYTTRTTPATTTSTPPTTEELVWVERLTGAVRLGKFNNSHSFFFSEQIMILNRNHKYRVKGT